MTTTLEQLRLDWEQHGTDDPLWAVLTAPGKTGGRWDPAEFFATGDANWAEGRRRMLPVLERASVRLRTDGSALDLGCGVGRVTQAIASAFREVIGIDISASMIEHANRYNQHENVRYVVGSGDSLEPIGDASVDFIWSYIALQHVPRPYVLRYIAEMGRVLAPGGVVHVQIPIASRHWMIRCRRALKRLAPQLVERVQRRLGKHARIQMHPVPTRVVIGAMAQAGLRVLDVSFDQTAAPSYQSAFYTAVKL